MGSEELEKPYRKSTTNPVSWPVVDIGRMQDREAFLRINSVVTLMHCRHPILALLLLGLLAHSAIAGQDQVALLLRENTCAALQGPLDQYVRDVESRFPVKVVDYACDGVEKTTTIDEGQLLKLGM